MKKIIILLFPFFLCFSQEKSKVIFNDGSEKIGEFVIRKPTFANSSSRLLIISKETKTKYSLNEISKVIIYSENDSLQYEVIDVKTNFNDKKTEKKLGLLAFRGNKINLYYVEETIHSGGAIGMGMVYDSGEAYAKKTSENTAYNIGYIYGAGARGIKKRVRDYFTDCKQLIEKVENDIISKDKTIDIIMFYENNCGM
jgi:hypothetical protein